MEAPLKGLRVIELARILAGPWIGQTLADLGADVIKIESPDGDDTRTWGPPFIGADAAYFHGCNRGKRSIALDLASPDGQAAARKLCLGADVVIENFKVGGLRKFGLDAASLRAENPRLVYCSVTGFGQDGPRAPQAGYDYMVQGLSGIMDLTGPADGEPQKMGVAFVDIFCALYAVSAIEAALLRRARTDEGATIDMALFDAQIGVLANQAMNYLATGKSPRRMGNVHPNIAPYQTFAASDGHFVIACGNDGQFRKLCTVLALDLADSAEFATNKARVANRDALVALIEGRTGLRTRHDLVEALTAAGVPAAPINTVAEAFADPQIIHRAMRIERGGAPGVRSPIVMDGEPMANPRGAPGLGEHTDEILREIGLRP